MRIKKITSQNRRDFYADYECEHCGAIDHSFGYDDDNFHQNVIPAMRCKRCGKAASDDYVPMTTKHPADAVI